LVWKTNNQTGYTQYIQILVQRFETGGGMMKAKLLSLVLAVVLAIAVVTPTLAASGVIWGD
jgi:hypothetical protein